jgi:hypothetical protein
VRLIAPRGGQGALQQKLMIMSELGSDSVIRAMSAARPLFPRKRKSIRDLAMSQIANGGIRSAQLFQPACRPKMRNCRDKQQKRGNRRDQAVNAKRVDKRDLQIGKIDRKAHTDGGIDERRQSKTTREWVVRKQCCEAQHVQVVHNPKVTYR